MCQSMVANVTLKRHIESLNDLIMEDYSKHEGQKDIDTPMADAVSDIFNRPGGITAQ